MLKKLGMIGLLAITTTFVGCSSDSAGEGEGEGTEGEGEEGEGEEGEGEEGEGEEGEGEEGEGEEGEGEEGEGEVGGDIEICDNGINDDDDFQTDCSDADCTDDPACAPLEVTTDLGDQDSPITVDLPFSEVVENPAPGGAECFSVTVSEPSLLTVTATSPTCRSTITAGDVEVFVYRNNSWFIVASNDDDGDGTCALLQSVLPPGDYTVCTAHYTYNTPPTTAILVPTTVTAALSPATLVARGGACGETTNIGCDLSLLDYTADDLADQLTCDTNVCTVIGSIAEGSPCELFDRDNQCDPSFPEPLQCLAVANTTDFRCAPRVLLEIGDGCALGSTASACVSPAVCIPETLVCAIPFAEACAAAVEATIGDNTVTMPATAATSGLACFGFPDDALTYLSYTATADAVLTIEASDGSIALRRTCETAEALCFTSQHLVVAGEQVFLSVEGEPGSTTTITISEDQAILSAGDSCVIPSNFGAPLSVCDAADTLYCGGNTCITAEPLELGVSVPFTSVLGTPSELCFAFTDAGTYTLTTSGSCSSGNDTQVRVLTEGILVDRDDDGVGGGSRCSTLTVTVEDGNHLACVSHFSLSGDVNAADFVVTLE